MIRCALMATTLALTALAPASAMAQVTRPFPATALRGELQVTQPPDILLNGRAARLSPGSRIRGRNNMLVLSGGIVGQTYTVHYTGDGLGNVHLVWILTAEEAAREPWPETAEQAARWQFNPSTQTWTRP